MLVLPGFVSIAFGIVIVAEPGDGAIVLFSLIVAFAIVTRVAELVAAIGGKRLVEGDIKRAVRRTRAQPAS